VYGKSTWTTVNIDSKGGEYMSVWGERIKQKRNEKGITLTQIASLLNVSEATAQRYESGSIKQVPYEHICSYAELFGCQPSYLMGWKSANDEFMELYELKPITTQKSPMLGEVLVFIQGL